MTCGIMLNQNQHMDQLLCVHSHAGYLPSPISIIFKYFNEKITGEDGAATEHHIEKLLIPNHVVGPERFKKTAKLIYNFWYQYG